MKLNALSEVHDVTQISMKIGMSEKTIFDRKILIYHFICQEKSKWVRAFGNENLS